MMKIKKPSRLLYGLIIGAASLLFALAGLWAAAPYLGLGAGESFLLYSSMSVSRGTATAACFLGGIVILFFGLTARFFRANTTGPVIAAITDIVTPVFRPALLHRDWLAAAMVAPFTLYIIVFYLVVMEGAAYMAPDSASYIFFTHYRPLGYPVLIRALAALSDNGTAIPLFQIVMGMMSCVLLVEGTQRVTRNYLVSVPLGIALVMNWQLLIYGAYILSDYPFFVLLTLNTAATLFLIDRPGDKRWILLIGLSVPLAVSIRANGLVLGFSLLFLAILHFRQWRRLILFGVTPATAGLVLLAAAHWLMFGNFSLTRMGGYQILANAMYILQPDTPFKYPDFVTKLYSAAKPFQDSLAKASGIRQRVHIIAWDTNPMLGVGSRVLADFAAENPRIPERKTGVLYSSLLNKMNDWPNLNRAFGRFQTNPANDDLAEWRSAFLSELAVSAHLHNINGFLKQYIWKITDSWRDQYTNMYYFPSDVLDELSHYPRLDPTSPTLSVSSEKKTFPTTQENKFVTHWPLRIVNKGMQWLSAKLPLLSLAIAVLAIPITLMRLIRGKPVEPSLAATAFAAAMVMANIAFTCLGHVPLPRYLVVAEGLALLLPLALIPLLFRLAGYFSKRSAVPNKR